MTNGELIQFLKNPEASAREPWAKVRWINVGGLSWDVISALALKYSTFITKHQEMKLTLTSTLNNRL